MSNHNQPDAGEAQVGTVCCGRRRIERYCPECGKLLTDDSGLADLLRHCERTAQSLRKQADNARLSAHRTRLYGHAEQKALTLERGANRWEAWANDLRKVLKSLVL